MGDERPSVAIIGAGPSGLAAAHHLVDSHRVSLFDSRKDVGGVWAQSSAQVYPWLETNTPTALFPYPGFPLIASDWEEFGEKSIKGPYVDGRTAQRYYARFAREKRLDREGRMESLKLETKVLNLRRSHQSNENKGWMVTYHDFHTDTTSTVHYDRVVIATGAFSTPSIPDFIRSAIDNEPFAFHSSSMGSRKFEHRLSIAKRVIIIGGGKSALDLMARVKTANGPSISLILPPRDSPSAWPLPHGRIPSYLSRMSLLGARYLSPWSAFDNRHKRNWLESTHLGRIIRQFYWNLLSRQVQMTFPALFPSDDKVMWKDILKSTSRLFPAPPGLVLSNKDSGVSILRGKVSNLTMDASADAAILRITQDDGTLQRICLDTNRDMIVACTGYTSSSVSISNLFGDVDEATRLGIPVSGKSDLDLDDIQWRKVLLNSIHDARKEDSLLAELYSEEDYSIYNLDTYKLYHHMVPINQIQVPNTSRDFAVIGLPQTLSAAIIADVQARWLSRYFQGMSLNLPGSVDEARLETARLIAASLSRYGLQDAKEGTTMSLELSWYANVLLSDIDDKKRPNQTLLYPFRALCSDDFL